MVRKDTLIVVDPSDVRKACAEKMPCPTRVWDGSKGRVGDNPGYNGCMAAACESGGRKIVPMMFRPRSDKAPGFTSENDEVQDVVPAIARKTKGRGVFVYDRGGDRGGFFEKFMDMNLRFIVRLVGNRTLMRLFTRHGTGWRSRNKSPPAPPGPGQMLPALDFAPSQADHSKQNPADALNILRASGRSREKWGMSSSGNALTNFSPFYRCFFKKT